MLKKGATAVVCLLLVVTGYAQQKTSDDVMKGFMDKRFGMFIHWGPVSLRGTEIGWSRDKQVSKEDYDSLYKEFDPILFNADKWAKVAKEAGMKYLTITARHHDGFCLWPTKFSPYNISYTPFKKDIVWRISKSLQKTRHKVLYLLYHTRLVASRLSHSFSTQFNDRPQGRYE